MLVHLLFVTCVISSQYFYTFIALGALGELLLLIVALLTSSVYFLNSFSRSQVLCRWGHSFLCANTVTTNSQLHHHAVKINFIYSICAQTFIEAYSHHVTITSSLLLNQENLL